MRSYTKTWPLNLTKKELHLAFTEMSASADNCTDPAIQREYRILKDKFGMALEKLKERNDREQVGALTRAQHEEILKERRKAAFAVHCDDCDPSFLDCWNGKGPCRKQPLTPPPKPNDNEWDWDDNELRRAEEG